MFSFGTNAVIGLDIGRATVKAVRMTAGKEPDAIQHRILDCRAEGVVDEADLVGQVLPEWLGEAGWTRHELTVGLPQYLATVQVSDFPPTKRDTLDNLVAYETQQLAGLSEERFIHDHVAMPPGGGRENPVLIAVCRDTVAEERAGSFEEAGLRVSQFSLAGVGLANACFQLVPELKADSAPSLLLDVGSEGSTLVMVAGGQILAMSTLMFGTHRMVNALAEELSLDEVAAENALRDVSLNTGNLGSGLARCLQQLVSELEGAVSHWRSQERPEIANQMFGHLCVTGGGAMVRGLAEQLGRRLGCTAHVVAPPSSDARMTIAYGLALQAAGYAAAPLSLTPEDVSWRAGRRRYLGHLVVASVLLTIALVVGLVGMHMHLREEREELRAQIAEYRACEAVIPKLEDVLARKNHREKMLIPIVAKGNRSRRFLAGLRVLGEAKDSQDWFIYFADRDSYLGRDLAGRASAGEPRKADPKRRRPTSVSGFFSGLDVGMEEEPENTAVTRKLASSVGPLESLVVAGYAPVRGGVPAYQPVRDMVDRLNQQEAEWARLGRGAMFGLVDWPSDHNEDKDREFFEPWKRFFKNRRVRRLKFFMLRLGFANLDITAPAQGSDKDKG